MDGERKAWERMEGESLKWFSRFDKFRIMKPWVRSVASVYHEENSVKQRKTTSKVPGDWYKIAELWKWKERVSAYDLEEQEKRKAEEETQRKEDLKSIREMLLRHIQATVEASSTSQIQAAKILHEYYIMTGDISELRDELQVLQDRMRSLENGQ